MESKLNQYIEGINNNDYHADRDFYSSSQVKQAISGHANFRWYMENGKKGDGKWKEGNAMDFGSLVHTLLLEPHLVDEEFAFMDTAGRNWRTKEDKTYKARFLEQHADKIVLSQSDRERAKICADMAMKHPFLNKLLTAPGTPEMSGFYMDPTYNLPCRFRPDRRIHDLNGGSAILDLKTTENIEDFHKKANWDFHYDLSAHMYMLGESIIMGEADVDFYFGVVESKEPYRVAVYKASDKFLERGMKKYNQAMSNIQMVLNIPKDKPVVFQDVPYQEI